MLPNTDGEIILLQGRNLEFTCTLLDETTKQPVVASGYELHMQIRATIDSDTVLIDCTDYADSSPTTLSAEVSVPAGITAALAMDDIDDGFAEWIADAKFVLTGSDPVEAIDAGRYTVRAYREVTR